MTIIINIFVAFIIIIINIIIIIFINSYLIIIIITIIIVIILLKCIIKSVNGIRNFRYRQETSQLGKKF